MPQWTNQQLDAIQSRGISLLISAGAGSGKTAVLTERAVTMFGEGLDPARLLVVTFTRAAAAEMKERMLSALFSRQSLSMEYRAAADRISDAQVSTIHAFCLSVVHSYAQLTGIDPGFSLLSEAEEKMLKEESLQEALEESYEKQSLSFIRLADSLDASTGRNALSSAVLSVYSFAQNQLLPESWIKSALDGYEPEAAMANALAQCSEAIQEALIAIGMALEILESDPETKRKAYFDQMRYEAIAIRVASEAGFEEFLQSIKGYRAARYDMRRNHHDRSAELSWLQKKAKAALYDLRDSFGFAYASYISHLAEAKVTAQALLELEESFRSKYAQKKAKKQAIDYSDLEHGCLAALRNDEAREAIAGSYDEIMVDEYQDTNEIQEAIVEMISRPGHQFFVGDAKQSIYRFRGANPSLFQKRYSMYGEGEGGELVILNRNFRSAAGVVSGINRIFDPLFFERTGGVDYYPTERLIANEDSDIDGSEAIALCQAHIAITSSRAVNSANPDEVSEAAMSASELEGELIANLIAELLTSGKTVVDKESGEQRPIMASDIAILSRQLINTHASYEKALRSAGISYESPYSEAYYNQAEVSLILNLLKVVDNELDDICLLAVMRSFVYCFSEDELFEIRSISEGCPFHEAAIAYKEAGGDDRLREKLESLYADIDDLRKQSESLPVSALTRAAVSRTNARSLILGLPRHEARLANLDYLCSLAASYEKSSFKGLYHFLKYAEARRESDAESRRPISEGGNDAVKLMTIHKSKGLEFEFVIIAGAHKSLASRENKDKIVCDSELGLCCDFIDLENMAYTESLASYAAKKRIERENAAEEMRLFYVALTRARSEVYVVGAQRKNPFETEYYSEPTEYAVLNAKSYLDWMAMALASSQGPGLDSAQSPWEAFVHMPPLGYTVLSTSIKAAEKKGIDWESLKRAMEFSYPYERALEVPAKLTATQLASTISTGALKGDQAGTWDGAAPIDECLPSFLQEEAELSAAAMGTLAHEAIKSVSIEKLRKACESGSVRQAIETELSKLGYSLDMSLIADFFESDLGTKMIQSEECHREQEFMLSLGAEELRDEWAGISEKVIVQGIIDCYFFYGGQLYLIDFKTDRVYSNSAAYLAAQKHSRQLGIYKRALAEQYGKEPDYTYVVFLSRGSLAVRA
ncbi:MAG: UvrD-helicase domain-containing protein [Eubacteriaceae bacterium]|nr:UvrD-helicase domain-containing protein [Eubacteriaceae bacterium]